MATMSFRLRGPDVRLAGAQFRALKRRIVRQIAHAVEAELIDLTPGSGELRNAWDVGMLTRDGEPVGLVINNYSTETGIPIMLLLEEGTGIFGPSGQPIKPTDAEALHFEIDGEEFIRRTVEGIDPAKHAFVQKALDAARPEIDAIIRSEAAGWYTETPMAGFN